MLTSVFFFVSESWLTPFFPRRLISLTPTDFVIDISVRVFNNSVARGAKRRRMSKALAEDTLHWTTVVGRTIISKLRNLLCLFASKQSTWQNKLIFFSVPNTKKKKEEKREGNFEEKRKPTQKKKKKRKINNNVERWTVQTLILVKRT